jgi:hypothetical protein
MALVNQATNQRQGNPNPALYALARRHDVGTVFHDITSGNNSVPGLLGYSAGPGWDPVTGLGSVDATALVTHWTQAFAPGGGLSIQNGRLTTQAPSPLGCTLPPAATSFQTSQGAIYLYFEATVTASDSLSTDWLSPDGSVLPGGSWSAPGIGSFCFNATLNIASLSGGRLGNWQARIYDNGTTVAPLAFTVASTQTTPPPPTGTNATGALPHVAAGSTWTTGIFAVNTSASTANFTVNFYDDNGHPLALPKIGNTFTSSLVAGGSAYAEAGDPATGLVGGWGQITADPGVTIQAIFRNNSNGTYYEAAVPQSTGSKEFVVPFDATTFTGNNSPFYTGFAIANLDPTTNASITCTARALNGNVIPNAVPVPTLGPLAHWANYLFPALSGLRGTIDCISNTKVAALALRFLGTNAFSSLTVITK